MTAVLTAKIRTSDAAELVDLLQALTSVAALDGRPVEIGLWHGYLEVEIGEAAEELGDVAELVAPHVPEVTPVVLGMADSETVAEHEADDQEYPPAGDSPSAPSDEETKGEDPQVTELDREDDDLLPAPPRPKDPFAGGTASKPAPQPVDGGDHGCVHCDATYGSKRAVTDHIRADHWTLVKASYSEAGVMGIARDWGVAETTARSWGRQLAALASPRGLGQSHSAAATPREPAKGPSFPSGGPIAKLPVDEAAARGAAAAAL